MRPIAVFGGRTPVMPPATFSPSVANDATTPMGSDEQPTLMVTRKIQGELTVAPAEVTAGSENDFTITYKATEELEEGEVIEVKLPAGWLPPTPYNFDLNNKLEAADGTMLADAEGPHVYLSGSISRLEGTEISVISGDGIDAFDAGGERDTTSSSNGWFVRIVLGSKDVSKDVSKNGTIVLNKNGTIVLKYNDATVQHRLTIDDPALASYDPASVEVFSGPLETVDSLPQFPVTEQKEVAVIHAADGSGVVKFYFDGDPIPALTADGKHNTVASIPAGIVKDDAA